MNFGYFLLVNLFQLSKLPLKTELIRGFIIFKLKKHNKQKFKSILIVKILKE